MAGQSEPIRVSREIKVAAADIFRLLTAPARHVELDGSGMVRGTSSTEPVTGVGDVFVMRMYFDPLGHYEMINHVVEYEPDRRIGWEPEPGNGHPGSGGARPGQRWSFELTATGAKTTMVTEIYDCRGVSGELREQIGDGSLWVGSMERTLARLDELCTAAADRKIP